MPSGRVRVNSLNCFELSGTEYIHFNLRIPSPHVDPTLQNHSPVFYESKFVDVSLGEDEVPDCARGLPYVDSDDISQMVMWPELWTLDDQMVPTSPIATSSCSLEYSFRKDLLSDLYSQITSDANLD